jgi:hypothetical protein
MVLFVPQCSWCPSFRSNLVWVEHSSSAHTVPRLHGHLLNSTFFKAFGCPLPSARGPTDWWQRSVAALAIRCRLSATPYVDLFSYSALMGITGLRKYALFVVTQVGHRVVTLFVPPSLSEGSFAILLRGCLGTFLRAVGIHVWSCPCSARQRAHVYWDLLRISTAREEAVQDWSTTKLEQQVCIDVIVTEAQPTML